jgi:hypothetical protein
MTAKRFRKLWRAEASRAFKNHEGLGWLLLHIQREATMFGFCYGSYQTAWNYIRPTFLTEGHVPPER